MVRTGLVALVVSFAAAGLLYAQPTINEFPIPSAGTGGGSIVRGPDGNLWFTEYTTKVHHQQDRQDDDGRRDH